MRFCVSSGVTRAVGKFCGHDFVEFGVLREPVHEGQDDVAIKQQPLAFAGVGHITELMGRNVELFSQNFGMSNVN